MKYSFFDKLILVAMIVVLVVIMRLVTTTNDEPPQPPLKLGAPWREKVLDRLVFTGSQFNKDLSSHFVTLKGYDGALVVHGAVVRRTKTSGPIWAYTADRFKNVPHVWEVVRPGVRFRIVPGDDFKVQQKQRVIIFNAPGKEWKRAEDSDSGAGTN